MYRHGDHVLGICEGEAFTHLSSEFKNPERIDFSERIDHWPDAGRLHLLDRNTAVVLHFGVYSDKIAAAASLPLCYCSSLRYPVLWVACIIGCISPALPA